MSFSANYVRSNKALVRDPLAAQEVFRAYQTPVHCRVFEPDTKGKVHIQLTGTDWPLALENTFLIERDVWPFSGDCFDVLESDGQEGFERMLLRLAPVLQTPLTVKAACAGDGSSAARVAEWLVRPGARYMEIKSFRRAHWDEYQHYPDRPARVTAYRAREYPAAVACG